MCLQRVINALNNIRTIKIKHVGIVSVWCPLLMETLLKLKLPSLEFKAQNIFQSANMWVVICQGIQNLKVQPLNQTLMCSGKKSFKLFHCGM